MAREALATFRIQNSLMKDKIEVTGDFLVPSLPAGEINDKKDQLGARDQMKVKPVIRQRATNGLKSNSKKNDWDKALLTRDSGLDLNFLFDNKTGQAGERQVFRVRTLSFYEF